MMLRKRKNRIGNQHVARISLSKVKSLIIREFPGQSELVSKKLNLISSDSKKGKYRICAAILKIADGDINKIDVLVERANYDFRDIISDAEYPSFSKDKLTSIPENEVKERNSLDWREYKEWLEKK